MDTAFPDDADRGAGLKRESRFGLIVGFLVTAGADVAIQSLTGLDTAGWSGWWAPLAIAAVGTAVGLLTAYKTRNTRPAA